MVFFIWNHTVSRSEPLVSYDEAIEEAKRGPKGAFFQISKIDRSEYELVIEGWVA